MTKINDAPTFEHFMQNYKPRGYYGEIDDIVEVKDIISINLLSLRQTKDQFELGTRELIFPIIPAIEVLTMSTDEIYEKYLPIEGEKNPPEGRMSAFDIFDPNVTLMELLNREDR